MFDYSEQRIDYGTQKQLSQCCKQLKTLSDLLIIVLKDYKQYIPDKIQEQLRTQSETVKMASDYQEVLQWLLNVGLLPEGIYDPENLDNQFDDEFLIVPYPYHSISSYYEGQRKKLAKDWHNEGEEATSYLFIDSFIRRECSEAKLREIWRGSYPPCSMQALLRTLLIPEIPMANKQVLFLYVFMDITKVLSEESYSSIVRNLIKFPAVFKMNPAMIKRTQAFWNLDNGQLDTAVEELISPLSHDKPLPLWQRELLIAALLKQNAHSLALRALRCPGNHSISPHLEVMTLLANNLLSEALKAQRANGNRALLEKMFEVILHSPNYEQLLELTLTDEEGSVLADYLNKLKENGLPTHLNIHFVFLLQRSKFIDAAQLVESLGNETSLNLDPPKQVLNAYYATMESTTRRLTSMVYRDDVQLKESPMPLSVNLIQTRCNAKNDIYHQCIQSITEAAHESSDLSKLPFIGSPKLGIFEYRQPTVNYQDISYSLETNEHGKRRTVEKKDQILNIELEAPQQKKRRLDDSIVMKKRSYGDKTLKNLTVFKEMKPNYSFTTRKSANSSLRTTPERVQNFGNFLSTPLVQKKTPPSRIPEKCPATPQSILKTRSYRGSVSPAPSRFSEFGDDNKSVKSITFAALPDSRDTSMNDSSLMEEENFAPEKPLESSGDAYFSPERSFEGPKPRKPLKSRSTTPTDAAKVPEQKPEEFVQAEEELQQVEEELNRTASSVASDEVLPLHARSVIKDSDFDSSSDASNSSGDVNLEKSILNYERKSVLPANYGQETDSSDEDPMGPNEDSEDSIVDEHFEEEELPDHSDYNESDDDAQEEYEYGDVNLDDSDSESLVDSKPAQSDDVICLDSSDEDDAPAPVKPSTLPSFTALGPSEQAPTSSNFVELKNVALKAEMVMSSQEELVMSSQEEMNISNQEMVISSQEEMAALLYENFEQQDEQMEIGEVQSEVELIEDDIESPPYEEVSVPLSQQTTVDIAVSQPVLGFALSQPTLGLALSQPFSLATTVEATTSNESIGNIEELKSAEIVVTSSQEDGGSSPYTLLSVTSSESFSTPLDLVVNKPIGPHSIEEPTSSDQMLAPMNLVKPRSSTNIQDHQSISSTDTSFVSASGGELNEAIFFSNRSSLRTSVEYSEFKTADDEPTNSLDKGQFIDCSMETARESINATVEPSAMQESENPLNVAQVCEEEPVFDEVFEEIVIEEAVQVVEEPENADENPTPSKKRKLSSRAGSVEPSDRETRARSVPHSGASSPRSRSQRASTEDRDNPKNLLKVKKMERIEESPLPSPGMLTRRRSQQMLDMVDRPLTPLTPTRSTRGKSLLSEDGEQAEKTLTPRRLTRATSKENLAKVDTPDEPGLLTRQPSLRNLRNRTVSASGDENDDAKSTRSTRSSKRKATPSSSAKVTPEKLSPAESTEELSVSNRRLTRRQLQVIEKSRQLTTELNTAGALRATKSDSALLTPAADDSDNESVTSGKSSVASSRASRKRKTPKKDDSSSVASKTSRRSPSPGKRNQLSVIPEESHEGKRSMLRIKPTDLFSISF